MTNPDIGVSTPVRKQSDIIAQLARDVETLKATDRVNQLNYAAMHNTALPIYDFDKNIRARLGKQPDGTYAIKYLNGSAPPMPSGIGVAERQLGILITWDGTFASNAPKPGDFQRLDVHISTTQGFDFSVDTLMGSLFTESALFIGADVTTHYVRLIAVNSSDVPSVATDEVAVTPLPATEIAAGVISGEHLNAELALIGKIIGGDPNAGHWEGDADGFRMYSTDQTVKINFENETGDATFIGVIMSGILGLRTVIDGAIVKFLPSTDESRYGYFNAFVPDNYPNDVALEAASSRQPGATLQARSYWMPDFLGSEVRDPTNNTPAGGSFQLTNAYGAFGADIGDGSPSNFVGEANKYVRITGKVRAAVALSPSECLFVGEVHAGPGVSLIGIGYGPTMLGVFAPVVTLDIDGGGTPVVTGVASNTNIGFTATWGGTAGAWVRFIAMRMYG
jgi:hypothetical protein